MVTSTVNFLKWKGMVPNDRVIITIQPSVDFYAVATAVLVLGNSDLILECYILLVELVPNTFAE